MEGFILTEVELFEIKTSFSLIRELNNLINKHHLPSFRYKGDLIYLERF